jgi:hypothetical protein
VAQLEAPDAHRSRPAPRIELPSVSSRPSPARGGAADRVRSERRPQVPQARTTRSAAAETEPLLAGVPLASLESCVSDLQEDALKQRVIAVVGGRKACSSAAGRYRFIETKNLNAFLLSIERAPSRPVADRCTELSLALECLERRG